MSLSLRMLSVAIAAIVPFAVAAQTPSISETIEVRVANVDVVVTDASGQRVTNLTRDDFQVFENGAPREITNLTIAAPSAPGAAPASTRVPRRIVLYFDNLSLSLPYRKDLITASKQFARTKLGPDDRLMIATFNRKFAVPLSWSNDVAAIDAALDVVAKETAGATQRDAEKRRIQQQISGLLSQDAAPSSGGNEPMINFDSLLDEARRYATNEQNLAKQSILSLDAFLQSLAGLDGRKIVLVASEWMPAMPGNELFQHLELVKQQIDSGSGSTRMRAGSRKSSPLSEMSRYSISDQVSQAQRTAAANHVMVYAASAMFGERGNSGNVENQEMSLAATESGAGTALEGLQSVVISSGGQSFVGMKPDRALETLAGDLDATYSLGYKPGGAVGSLSKLEVRVKNPAYKVRSQRSILVKSADQDMEERVVANHVQQASTNDLQILARHLEITPEGNRRKVPVQVLIPVQALAMKHEGSQWSGAFTVYLCSANAKGETTPVTKQNHDIRWTEEQMAQLRTKAIGFAIDVIVEPSVDRISIGVVDRSTGITGFQRLQLPQ